MVEFREIERLLCPFRDEVIRSIFSLPRRKVPKLGSGVVQIFAKNLRFLASSGVKIEQFSCVERGKKQEVALVRESPPRDSKLSSFDHKSSGFSPDSSLRNTSNLASFLHFAQIL